MIGRSVRNGFVALALLTVAAPSVAQPVSVARASGMVGERYDGYLGMSSAGSPGLRAEVASINIKRRSLYSGLAQRRGATPAEVGITAACQLLGSVAVGEVYMLGDNVWRRRGAGQAAPAPDYCR